MKKTLITLALASTYLACSLAFASPISSSSSSNSANSVVYSGIFLPQKASRAAITLRYGRTLAAQPNTCSINGDVSLGTKNVGLLGLTISLTNEYLKAHIAPNSNCAQLVVKVAGPYNVGSQSHEVISNIKLYKLGGEYVEANPFITSYHLIG